MNLDDFVLNIWDSLGDQVIQPLALFLRGLNQDERSVLYALLALASAAGFLMGRRLAVRSGGRRHYGARRFPAFQNRGEASVSRVISSNFSAPNYHQLNHVTLRMDDGTTQIDHILVSRFGVFVIETKDYSGWIFANAAGANWTKVLFQWKSKFQNPILQNSRHIRAVRDLLDFLPPEAIKSVVVFGDKAEFKTDIPQGVTKIGQLAEYLGQYTEPVMSLNRQQFCVGRLETARLSISRETDVEHVQSLARRHGRSP